MDSNYNISPLINTFNLLFVLLSVFLWRLSVLPTPLPPAMATVLLAASVDVVADDEAALVSLA